MVKTTYNLESLKRHRVSSIEVDDVIATGIWEEITPNERGNNRLMFIGFTAYGRLLEVGVEYFDDNDIEHVFHAANATNHYQKVFQKRMIVK